MEKLDNKPGFKNWVVVLVFMVIFLIPRLVDLATYATADEPLYLKSSATFYYLISEKRFDETDLIIHPGVVNLWAGAGGVYLHFPEYASHSKTEAPIADLHFRNIIERSGYKQMVLLAYGRAITVFIQAVILGAALYYGQRVLGRWPAFLGFLLISFEPFYFANSRILQPDGILAASLLLSVIAFIDHLQTNKSGSLVVSGIGAGLCWLSKLVGIVLGPMVFAIAVFVWWRSVRGDRQKTLRIVRALILWLVVAVVVFMALWPAMWSDPIGTLSAYFNKSFLMSQDVNSPMFFNGSLNPEGEFGIEYFYYYLLVIFNLTTPVVLIGLVFGVVSLFWKQKTNEEESRIRFPAVGLSIALVVFLMIMTLSNKKADRYVVSAFILLDLLAGIGYWMLLKRLGELFPKAKAAASVTLVAVIVALQAFLVWRVAPYYHSYFNPMWGSGIRYAERFQVGWGEGLEQAADYLNGKDQMNEKVVFSWYSATFDLFFNFRSNEIFIPGPLLDAQYKDILAADYAVIYISQWQRQSDTLLIQYLADKQPEYTVEINGLPYVKVFNMKELNPQTSE